MATHWPASLVLAGAGKMGGAMLRGWLAEGLPPDRVRIVDPYPSDEIQALCREAGIGLTAPEEPPEVFVLAIKPQTFADAPSGFASKIGPKTLIVSILAGKTIANLRAAYPQAGAIVRAMPNLPAAIRRGSCGLAGEQGRLSPQAKEVATSLLKAVGFVDWLDESLIDAVTAVSGSGPAYVFLFTECLAQAGKEAGLSAEAARQFARFTVEGAAALMSAEPGKSVADLRAAVTSKGGTTAAALDILQKDGALATLMGQAVEAARKRAAELAS